MRKGRAQVEQNKSIIWKASQASFWGSIIKSGLYFTFATGSHSL